MPKAPSPEAPFKVIAHVSSEFPTKFGIPRQSNLVRGLRASLVFTPEYRSYDAVRGLEAFSHLWLVWEFSEAKRNTWSATVRPPRLGGNVRIGVFASRSPFRPNPIGLSSVRLLSVERHPDLGPILHISGADLMDSTAVYDIKPYIPFTDCHPEAYGAFAGNPPTPLTVSMDDGCADLLPRESEATLREVLAQDPRPPYHRDPQRIYGMEFGEFEVKFSVEGDVLTVRAILPRVRQGKPG